MVQQVISPHATKIASKFLPNPIVSAHIKFHDKTGNAIGQYYNSEAPCTACQRGGEFAQQV